MHKQVTDLSGDSDICEQKAFWVESLDESNYA